MCNQTQVCILRQTRTLARVKLGCEFPTMPDLIQKALTAKRESKSVEFKETFDPTSPGDWCEVVKDIVAIANSGGGRRQKALKSLRFDLRERVGHPRSQRPSARLMTRVQSRFFSRETLRKQRLGPLFMRRYQTQFSTRSTMSSTLIEF